MFIGREIELNILESAYRSAKSELAVVYGRRRIGKSALISQFLRGKPAALAFEALEHEQTDSQLKHFSEQLGNQLSEPLLKNAAFKDWRQAFDYITRHVVQQSGHKGKVILFFDELQWMAAGKNTLIGLLKYFWDNHWKNAGCMLILCGSVSSFMIKNVIQSKALYGRTSIELHLKAFLPGEAYRFFQNRISPEDALKYLLIFGGIPKYLEEIKTAKSFNQNMNALCFSKNSFMLNEPQKIFHSQFRRPETYLKIIKQINKARFCTSKQIGLQNDIHSGGGRKSYLDNLLHADIIMQYAPFNKPPSSKLSRYGLCDEFLHFYFRYIEPHRRLIQQSRSAKLFEAVTKTGFDSWLGFSFERFCHKHAGVLAEIMGFADEMILAAPLFGKSDERFQIDLLYKRTDKIITLCEIKHMNKSISTTVIPEVERKKKLLTIPRGYSIQTALISLYGPDEPLAQSRYFDQTVTLKDLFS